MLKILLNTNFEFILILDNPELNKLLKYTYII